MVSWRSTKVQFIRQWQTNAGQMKIILVHKPKQINKQTNRNILLFTIQMILKHIINYFKLNTKKVP